MNYYILYDKDETPLLVGTRYEIMDYLNIDRNRFDNICYNSKICDKAKYHYAKYQIFKVEDEDEECE